MSLKQKTGKKPEETEKLFFQDAPKKILIALLRNQMEKLTKTDAIRKSGVGQKHGRVVLQRLEELELINVKELDRDHIVDLSEKGREIGKKIDQAVRTINGREIQ